MSYENKFSLDAKPGPQPSELPLHPRGGPGDILAVYRAPAHDSHPTVEGGLGAWNRPTPDGRTMKIMFEAPYLFESEGVLFDSEVVNIRYSDGRTEKQEVSTVQKKFQKCQ